MVVAFDGVVCWIDGFDAWFGGGREVYVLVREFVYSWLMCWDG
jgi:hypothetical protein